MSFLRAMDALELLALLLSGQVGLWSIAYLLGENKRLRNEVEILRNGGEGAVKVEEQRVLAL